MGVDHYRNTERFSINYMNDIFYICDISLPRQFLNALKVVSDLVVTLSLFQYFAPM